MDFERIAWSDPRRNFNLQIRAIRSLSRREEREREERERGERERRETDRDR